MSWLSPVSWAKWTWTAVRGGEGEGEEDEGGLEENRKEEEEEEERSLECRQVWWTSDPLWGGLFQPSSCQHEESGFC